MDHMMSDASSVSESEQPKSRFGLLILIGCGLLVLAVVAYLSYGTYLHSSIQTRITQTSEKLSELEEYGTNTDTYYATIAQHDSLLAEPASRVRVWELATADGLMQNTQHTVNLAYRDLSDAQTKVLSQSLNRLKDQMQLVTHISFDGKDEIESSIVAIDHALESESMSLTQAQAHDQTISQYLSELNAMVKQDVLLCNKRLEETLATGVNFTIPGRDQYIQEATQRKSQVAQLTTQQLAQEKETCSQSIAAVEGLIEQAKKDLVLTNITSGLTETESLITFFQQRSGYDSELAQLQEYRTQATTLIQETAAQSTSDQLQQVADTSLTPILEQMRSRKQQVEEQERLAAIEEQKRIAAAAGIPVPPVEAPKLILIDVPSQRLYAYENGISIFDAPVPITTGKAGFDTVRGSFSIQTKIKGFRLRSPFPGIFYDSYVDYWMPFFQGYGIHDASWRSVYGTMDYPSVGSHGCVNVPYNYVSQLYYWAEIGTPVIVQ